MRVYVSVFFLFLILTHWESGRSLSITNCRPNKREKPSGQEKTEGKTGEWGETEGSAAVAPFVLARGTSVIGIALICARSGRDLYLLKINFAAGGDINHFSGGIFAFSLGPIGLARPESTLVYPVTNGVFRGIGTLRTIAVMYDRQSSRLFRNGINGVINFPANVLGIYGIQTISVTNSIRNA